MLKNPSISTVTGPAAEPVTLAEAKLWMKIDDTTEDALITELIKAAREAAEKYIRRSLITQTLKLTVDSRCSGMNDCLGEGVHDLPVSILDGGLPRVIELPSQPVQSVTEIKTYNSAGTDAVFSSDNYYLDSSGGRVILKESTQWPSDLRRFKTCEITFVAGFGAAEAVPAAIKTGIKMHVQKMYDERMVCDLPDGCAKLYRAYKIYG